jgi:uncharacterized membrane protein (DUF373 family)
MKKHEEEVSFPLETDNYFINFLQKIILWGVRALAIFMTLVVLWSVIDIGVIIYSKIRQPPYLILNIEDILGLFGAFLVVLIAIEVFLNVILYLRSDLSHLKLVVATALMAISRKIIILDYTQVESSHILYGMAALVVGLGITLWLLYHRTS